MRTEDNLIRDFERENHILIDAENQVEQQDGRKNGIWKDKNMNLIKE